MRLLVFACLAVALLTAAAAHASIHAAAAKSCSAPKYPGDGYFTALSVKGTSCATGRKVALAHYHCRVRHGKAGRCSSRVLGYSCSEKRESIPTQYEAVVHCRRGSARVNFSYQQNT